MSNHAIKWALSRPLRSSTRFVLVVLANHADEDGRAWPSVAAIVEQTGLDRKTVLRALAEIRAARHIRDTGERTGRTGQVVVWKLNNSPENGTVKESQIRDCSEDQTVPFFPSNGPNFSDNGPNFPSKQSQIWDTETSGTIKGNPKETSCEVQGGFCLDGNPTCTDAANNAVSTVFEYWKAKLGRERAKLDSKRRKLIERALRLGDGVEDLKKAIDGCAASPWHMGSNPGGKRYDDLGLILRDAAKIEQFIGYTKQAPRTNTGTPRRSNGVHIPTMEYSEQW